MYYHYSQGGRDFTPSLLLQILGVKIVMTALCKGSGLVGGIYAPSIFMGAHARVLDVYNLGLPASNSISNTICVKFPFQMK